MTCAQRAEKTIMQIPQSPEIIISDLIECLILLSLRSALTALLLLQVAALDTSSAAHIAVRGVDSKVNVLLGVQTNVERRDVHDLLANTIQVRDSQK
jgi:hypothetical protein